MSFPATGTPEKNSQKFSETSTLATGNSTNLKKKVKKIRSQKESQVANQILSSERLSCLSFLC